VKIVRTLALAGLAALTLGACAQPSNNAGEATGWGCPAAYAYLAAHAAPGTSVFCGPGSALGHYGVTWINPKVVHIACPAPFVYMNEAYNSWLPDFNRPYDPYGQGTPAEDASCDNYR
jgi:hypothetical protein